MTKKSPYSYTVLRYMHDVITGEFVNVGVVLFVPSGNILRAKMRTSVGRIKGVFPDLDRRSFVTSMHSVRRGIRRITKEVADSGFLNSDLNAAELARRAVPADDSSLQWSPIGTGLTDSPDNTLERLYERFVTRYDAHSPHRTSDEDVWRPVREKLAERKLSLPLQEKVVVGATDAISFKHAWKNGQWHAYEPISLDLADAEGIKDKARRWRGHLAAVADGNPEQFKLHFILGAPQDPSLKSAYENAVAILRKSPFHPSIYEENQIDDLVSKMEDEYRAHEKSAH
ncbi:DUF3037 domain-containing protein [Microvirga sp. P5_D2]